jgi:YHS domain-containing protein
MCEKRIPKEKEVRMAVDPVSKKQVDKAKAVIAITGDNSEVSYFENNKNYKTFFKQK